MSSTRDDGPIFGWLVYVYEQPDINAAQQTIAAHRKVDAIARIAGRVRDFAAR
jgi:hypothetical protein